MMRALSVFMLPLLLLLCTSSRAQDNAGVTSLEQVFAIASVMTDSDALTFGVANFELKYLFSPSDPKWGDEQTLAVKKSIDTYILPYQWQLDALDEQHSHALSVRASYIQVQRDDTPLLGYSNFKQEQVVAGFMQYAQRYEINDAWYVGASIGTHVMHYRNQYQYSDGFPESVKAVFDGYIFNTTALVLMAEPVFNIGYQQQQSWGQWRLHNSSHYLLGKGIGGDAHDIHDVRPEGWRVSNGLELTLPVPQLWGVSDHVTFDMKRVDVGGDMAELSNHDYYYEASLGWVIDTKQMLPLLDNIGVGINLNYGSSVGGGTLLFYYNE